MTVVKERERSVFRFVGEQMEVFRHDHVPVNAHGEAAAHLLHIGRLGRTGPEN
jgi:hypothetical protein